jgi:DNA-binding NtrC family response regulator
VSAAPTPASVILASARGDDRVALREALEGTPFALETTLDLSATAAALAQASVPIVLYDRDLPGPGWQEAFEQLASVRKRMALILLSNVSDPYLSDEVAEHRGFDVLTRPFQRQEVLSLLLFARTHCTVLWPSRPAGLN